MKDIQKSGGDTKNVMAKVTALKKKERTVAKRQKHLSPPLKLDKIQKLTANKAKVKVKDLSKKKVEKKTTTIKKEEKKEPKKKQVREPKPNKTSKACSSDVGRKRNISQKKDSINDYEPLSKMRKMSTDQCDFNKLINGNSLTPQITNNPWVLKLDITQPQVKPVVNGSSSNGLLPISNKSLIIIPKKNVAGVSLKRRTSISHIEEKCKPTSKQTTSKLCAISNKGELKNGFDSNSVSSLGLFTKRKVEPGKSTTKKNTDANNVKEQKNALVNNQKTSKPPCVSCQVPKPLSKASTKSKNNALQKDEKIAISNVKALNQGKGRPPLSKQQVCLKSKTSKSQCAKLSKFDDKKPKASNTRSNKKSTVSDNSKALCLRNQTKTHPQRIASLDALAKMHVICSTDRRVATVAPKQAIIRNSDSKPHVTNTRKYQYKKEMQDGKGHVFRSQINCVKYEQSSVSCGTEKVSTFCSFSQEQEQTISKRPRRKPRLKPIIEVTDENETFKFNEVKSKPSRGRSRESQEKCSEKKMTKSTRVQRTVTVEKSPRISKKKEKEIKSCKKDNKDKVEKKSKVKVKETIRMRKTCTYQSVTTVSSHKEVNSVVSSCSTLGVTTNIETKKTVVRDETRTGKNDIRIEEIQEPFIPILESPLPHVSNCYNHSLHSPSQSMIPLAHSQPCHRHNGLDRPSTSQSHCCDGEMPTHRCGHREPLPIHRVMHECGCCCPVPLAQHMHDSCNLSKETNSCSDNSCCHLNNMRYQPHPYCHNISLSEPEHSCSLSAASHQNRWCYCHDICHSTPQHGPRTGCTPCPSATNRQFAASLVPFDPIPLDLSIGSPISSSVQKSNNRQSRTHCKNLHYCQEHTHYQPFSHNCSCSYPCGFIPCTPCWNRNINCRDNEMSQTLRPPVADSNRLSATIPSATSISSSSNNESSLTDLICQEISTIHNYACSSEKQKDSTRVSTTKKRKFAHGWSWEGEPVQRMLALTNDSVPIRKLCYPALRHKEGDVIKERDCVLLKSGPRETDLPYVAKVAAFWENDDDGEMMMSLLWYYRPEHTEQGRRYGQRDDEVFASKHRDVNSVACIEDKCFVLTYNEYCRYRSNLSMIGVTTTSNRAVTVPEQSSDYPRQQRLPNECVSADMIFFCRHVYDFRQKRILKNPT